ncbi:TonB-dependent receptor [Pedobacter sp. L105]|uniref:TonB-dependent receptor n=1 Tax=Pedobacter sp. L105 TaxID=1641871 RepID=UPI0020B14DF7|nr:TonB-dependent receptor [Pedobacter sp. L105]
MKKLFFLTTMMGILGSGVMAQVSDSTATGLTQNIRGTITDKNSGLALAGVTITLNDNQTKSAVSTAKGYFRLTGILVGRHHLEVTRVGYQTVILSDLLVIAGKEAEVNVEMETASKQLNEVAVSATSGKKPLNLMAMSSGRSFSPEETNRYAGAMFDPARMAQSFAGVVAGGDNNEIIVRGNSPMSLQWRLEGIEIISPNHFGGQGSSGGAVSMLNSTVLGTSDFYTGAVPAEYNNATAGVFDLKFRKGNTDKPEYAFTVGVLGAGTTLEGPFKKGGDASYLISYRYSALDLLQKLGVNVSSGSGVPRYQDLSFNFVVPTKGTGTFSLFGIGGLGGLTDNAKHDFTQWDERTDADNSNLTYSAGSIGLKHVYIANSKLYINNIISYSGDRSVSSTDTLTKSYQASAIQRSHYDNGAIRYAGTVNYQVNASNTIRTGLNASLLSYNLYDLEYKKESNGLEEILNQQGNAHTFDAYIENKHQFKGGVSINTGVHANYFNLSNTWSVEPRVGVNWQVTPDQLLTFASGEYSRLEPLSYYFARGVSSGETTNAKLSPTKSAQLVMGYEKQFSGRLKFKTEIYYQHLSNVPVSSDPASNFSLLNVSDNSAIESVDYTSLVNKGTGKNYGLELSLEKSMSNGYYVMITSTLFNSKFTALSGQEFNSTFDTRYVGNLIAGKEWATGKNNKNIFGLNGKLIYAGGRKYSPINLQESLKLDEQVIDESKVNTLTADPYIRVDFSASYRINKKKTSHFILLDIQNLLNRENNLGLWYNPSKRDVELNKWIGIFPTLNYRIEF